MKYSRAYMTKRGRGGINYQNNAVSIKTSQTVNKESKIPIPFTQVRIIALLLSNHIIQVLHPLISFFSLSAFSLIWLLVRNALHFFLGFFLVLAPKILVDLSASCLASWPTCTFRFLMADSMLLWFDNETCINWVIVSSSLVVISYKSGLWLEGRMDGPSWSLLKLFPGWNL